MAPLFVPYGWFWRGSYNGNGEWTWNGRNPAWDSIRHNWDLILQVANGEKKLTDLPKVARQKPESKSFDTDLDDDCPF